jgi:hypothetical protein
MHSTDRRRGLLSGKSLDRETPLSLELTIPLSAPRATTLDATPRHAPSVEDQ